MKYSDIKKAAAHSSGKISHIIENSRALIVVYKSGKIRIFSKEYRLFDFDREDLPNTVIDFFKTADAVNCSYGGGAAIWYFQPGEDA